MARRFTADTYPDWIREVDLALPVRPQFIVTGNIRDDHRLPKGDPDREFPLPTTRILAACLIENGYQAVFRYDPIDGLSVDHEAEEGAAAKVVPGSKVGVSRLLRLDDLVKTLTSVVGVAEVSAAIIVDFASRFRGDNQDPPPDLHGLFRAAAKLAHTADPGTLVPERTASVYNPVIWLVDREQDLPHWLAGIEPVRVISIPMPNLDEREREAELLLSEFPGWTKPTSKAERDKAASLAEKFAGLTHGMGIRSMWDILKLAQDGGLPADRIDDAVRTFRTGIPYNPWREPDVRGRISEASKRLGGAVLGQPVAVERVIDILMRSAAGLTGAQSRGPGGRPQGVLFFAGPTGVGKTEMAKQLAKLVFGAEAMLTRFDMSEFTLEHSEARLIGSPPGYVGHDAGGELTNAVRQRPFSVLLFDEIEKAHPRILDKFLQILDDGRLTDGSGSTVYFSETIVVFTSNLGVFVDKERTPPLLPERKQVIFPDDPPTYEARADKIRQAIRDHFMLHLGRPELLNRIGEDNIIVFDFITREVGESLVVKYVGNVTTRLQDDTGIELDVPASVMATVAEAALGKLEFGGRGIGAGVETAFINPLARALFDVEPGTTSLTVASLAEEAGAWRMTFQ